MAGGGCDVHDIHHIHDILDDVHAGLEGFHIFLDTKLEPTGVRPDSQIIFSQARIGGRSNNADSAKILDPCGSGSTVRICLQGRMQISYDNKSRW
jgi:hypothetical protein